MTQIKFGTDGWRAIIAREFTFDNVKTVSQAIALYLKAAFKAQDGIVIGYDNRFLSEQFAATVAEVMAGNEIKVYLVKQATPTPVTAHAIKQVRAGGAVMLTASHNPAEYHGMKFIPEYAGPAFPAITKAIEARLDEVLTTGVVKNIEFKEAEVRGLVQWIEPEAAYLEHLAGLIDTKKIAQSKLKIIFDPIYGAGIGYLDRFLAGAGCAVEVIRNWRDPLFGGHLPDPSAEILEPLQEKVINTSADLGLATDGDADRFGIIDRDGAFYPPNQIIALLCYYLVRYRGWKGTVARSVATTHLIDRIAARYGLQVDEQPVGFKYIAQSMLDKDSFIGGEESGGLSIRGHIPEKDGILATALVAEMVATTGQSIGELLAAVTAEVGNVYSCRYDLHCSYHEKERIFAFLATWRPEVLAGRRVSTRNAIDGVKLVLEDQSWVLIRPSGTEPLFRLYVESPAEGEVPRLRDAVQDLLGLTC